MKRLAIIICAGLLGFVLATGTALAAYQFQTSWGTAGAGDGQFTTPALIAVGPDGSVYVADTGNQRVEKFDANGAFLLAFGSAGAGNGQFSGPSGVAVGPDGSVYVTDTGNNRVERFDANGTFVSTWGTAGAGDGQFQGPEGIATASDGSVYVGDAGNARVERFFADGTFENSFTSGAGGFGAIRGVAVGPDGSVYVVDAQNTRVEHFDANGAFQNSWGSAGAGDGQFQTPVGIAASAAGVYVADSTQGRVQKFNTAGAFVDAIDAAGSGDPQLAQPSAVAISQTGLIYVLGGSRVSSYTETGGANLPPPTTGETANVEPVSGTVKVKTPGSNSFVLLSDGASIPIGSIVDVTHGTVELTTSAGGVQSQTARFYSGVFKLTQAKAKKPVTELQLYGSNFKKACPAPRARRASASGSKKKVVRQLWGSGKGNFRTKGKYASATIRGTQWLTQDRCDGTLVRVAQGSVTVRDLAKGKNKVVTAPHSFLVAAKKR